MFNSKKVNMIMKISVRVMVAMIALTFIYGKAATVYASERPVEIKMADVIVPGDNEFNPAASDNSGIKTIEDEEVAKALFGANEQNGLNPWWMIFLVMLCAGIHGVRIVDRRLRESEKKLYVRK